MGQQQLLLVILVTVIVGIATVVAINTFSSASTQANRDAVTNDVVAIAAAAQAYYIKPLMLRGGDKDFSEIKFGLFSFNGLLNEDSTEAININGTFVISDEAEDEFTVTAYPSSCEGYTGSMPATVDDEPEFGECDEEGDAIVATVLVDNIEWN